MYPLNMSNGAGYAVANTEAEHIDLSEAGYLPKHQPLEVSQTAPAEVEPIKRAPGRPRKAD